MPWGTFKLSELKLDQQNIRTGDQPDQRACIRALIDDQKQKLLNLALDLMDVGPSPGEPIWVTADPDETGRYIVLEGNRRVASLKILDNPMLAAETELAADFMNMAKEFASNPRREFDAQIFASREDARPWIERRHMSAESGVSLQPWGSLALERQKLSGDGSIRRSLLVLNYLDDGTAAFNEVGAIINAKATTVDRVLNAPAMADALGVRISRKDRTITFDNGDDIAGRRLLRELIAAMARPDFSFSKIRDAEDRDRFIRGFVQKAPTSGEMPGKGNSDSKPSSPAAEAAPVTSRTTARKSTQNPRPTLAPRTGSRVFAKVAGTRLGRIYRECKNIRLEDNENAAALLLRVFIELSSEAFLIEKNVPIPAARKGKTDWSEIGITLYDKISSVISLIDVNMRTRQQLKKARVALSNIHGNGSIDTLHAYFHNLDMTPDAPSLRDAWDTWENYLSLLHAARN